MMKTIKSTEAKQRFGALLEMVIEYPVVIERHKKECAVMMSLDSYNRMYHGYIEYCKNYDQPVPGEFIDLRPRYDPSSQAVLDCTILDIKDAYRALSRIENPAKRWTLNELEKEVDLEDKND